MMLFLVCLSFSFIVFQLMNVIVNCLFRQKIRHSNSSTMEIISILIPARDEEQNIELLLSDLRKIDDCEVEIIVFDDQSSDSTADIVRRISLKDNRVRLYQSTGLPEKWLGKNYACYQLSQRARGQYLLFLDADVRVEASIVNDAVRYMKKHRLGLISVFPKQIQMSFGERVTVPIMNYILLTLLPLIFVRVSPFSSHSAANGQFMLFDNEVYRANDPHRQFAMSAVEDIQIARYLKNKKEKVACVTGEDRIRCRMYHSYKEAINGFTKNVFMFFGNKAVLAIAFWGLAALGFIPVMLYSLGLLGLYIALVVLIQILYSLACGQNFLKNIELFPLQLLFLINVIIISLKQRRNKKYLWKDRNVYS